MRWIARATALVLAATLLLSGSFAQTTSVSVANATPVVSSVTLPTDPVAPVAGGSRNVTATVVVTDLNGCSDIASVTVEVVDPSGATRHAAAPATYQSCSAGTAATYTRTFALAFHDAPAIGTDSYKVRVVVTDRQGATGDNLASLGVFQYAELAALRLGSSAIDFGAVAPGNASSVLPLSVENQGNVRIDAQLSGTNLAHASADASIGVANLRYALASSMSNATSLGSSAATLSAFDLAAGASSARSLHWQLTAPDGSTQWVPSGTYAGTLTVTSVKG